MQRIDNDWLFTERFEDGFEQAVPVRLPHTVREMPLHYPDSEAYQMISGYRRSLYIEKQAEGKRIFLQFDGCAHAAEVFVNGEMADSHACGYTAFRVEITQYVRCGADNIIDVKLDSREDPARPPFGFVIDYLTYGGIYRDVWLDMREPSYIEEVYVTTPDLKSCEIAYRIEGDVEGLQLQAQILDAQEKCLAEKTADAAAGTLGLKVPEAACWDTEHPVLYTARLCLQKDGKTLDTQEAVFGFRTLDWNENQFLLNGRPLFLRGLNRHQCYPYIGYAAPESLQREDARILDEELQVNSVRTSHYPQSHYFLDECDRRGILVFTEIPGWQHVSKDRGWREQCVRNVQDMVRQYRQHPSVFLWGVRVNESQDDDELYALTNQAAHELDPTRKTSGVRYLEKSSLLEDVYSYNDFSHEGTNAGARPKKAVTPDMKKPLLISEANGHMFPTKAFDPQHKRQDQALRHAAVLNAAMEDGAHAGCYQWCMFDYPTHKDFGSGDRICYHGVMDQFRNPKLAASVYAMQGEDSSVLEIGSSMDIGDYSAGRLGRVFAFTNADEVKLYKNEDYVASFSRSSYGALPHGPLEIGDTIGELLKTKEGMDEKEAALIRSCLLAAGEYGMAGLPLRYKLKLAWAMLRYKLTFADGYRLYGNYVGNWGEAATRWRFDAVKDGRVVRSVTRTPGTKLHLDVRVSSTELTEGDTYDMSAVRIRLLDESGGLASYCQIPVIFSVEGCIELVGEAAVTAEGGMTGTYIRTTGRAGDGALRIHTGATEDQVIRFRVSKQ